MYFKFSVKSAHGALWRLSKHTHKLTHTFSPLYTHNAVRSECMQITHTHTHTHTQSGQQLKAVVAYMCAPGWKALSLPREGAGVTPDEPRQPNYWPSGTSRGKPGERGRMGEMEIYEWASVEMQYYPHVFHLCLVSPPTCVYLSCALLSLRCQIVFSVLPESQPAFSLCVSQCFCVLTSFGFLDFEPALRHCTFAWFWLTTWFLIWTGINGFWFHLPCVTLLCGSCLPLWPWQAR